MKEIVQEKGHIEGMIIIEVIEIEDAMTLYLMMEEKKGEKDMIEIIEKGKVIVEDDLNLDLEAMRDQIVEGESQDEVTTGIEKDPIPVKEEIIGMVTLKVKGLDLILLQKMKINKKQSWLQLPKLVQKQGRLKKLKIYYKALPHFQ